MVTTSDSSSASSKQKLKNRVLKILYFKGARSIPEISRRISKTIPTTTTLIEDLLSEKAIDEIGIGDSSGGRKPSLYAIRPNSGYIFTINVRKSSYSFCLYNLKNEVAYPAEKHLYKIENADKELNTLLDKANNYIKKTNVKIGSIMATAVSMPGIINSKSGINYSYFKPEKLTLQQKMEQQLKTKVFIENDTRVMTIGEYRFGIAKGKRNILCVNYNRGIGLGMLLNGEIYSGKSGFAGEFGHIQIRQNGTLCYCGKQGCLESSASGQYLINEAKNAINDGITTQLLDIVGKDLEKLDLSEIITAALQGDEFTIDLMARAADDLGRGLAMLVHLLNPEIIILGGTLAKAGKYILTPVQHAVNKYSLSTINDDVEIAISKLEEEAIPLGLISLAIDKVLE